MDEAKSEMTTKMKASSEKPKTKLKAKEVKPFSVSEMFYDKYNEHWPTGVVDYVVNVLKQFDNEPMETFYDDKAEWDKLVRELIQSTVRQYCQINLGHFRVNSGEKLLSEYKKYHIVEMVDLDSLTVYNAIYDTFGRNMPFFSE